MVKDARKEVVELVRVALDMESVSAGNLLLGALVLAILYAADRLALSIIRREALRDS